MHLLQRIAVIFLLFIAVLLFAAVGIVGPDWVTEHVILKFVSLPGDIQEPVFEETPVSQAMVDSLITDEAINTRLTSLTSLTSRVAGYPGNRTAMEYVRSAFEGIGLEDVSVEPFRVMSPVDHGFTLTIEDGETGETVTVYQLWPNLVRLNSFPDGITGPLLYGQKGEFSAFNGRQVDGSIVLLDFDCRDQYLNARMLGAQAILFFNSSPGAVSQHQATHKILDVPANVPRFWVEDEDAERLLKLAKTGTATVTIRGSMSWEDAETWNVMGWLPGLDEPIPGSDDEPRRWKDDIIVLSAYYDAMSSTLR